jgi:ParB-like chromosome segregation protein Spo0J
MSQEIQVELVEVESLIPYARNARTHSDAQVAQLAASIKEFGWTNPILIDGDKGIIAGHGRLMAARKLGYEKVPVIELKGMSDAQKRAYILADNKLALNAGWDDDLLNIEIQELKELDYDLDLTGFTDAELDELASDPWASDIESINKIEEKDSTAKGRLVITFEEKDREQIREAVTNLVDQLGLEGVNVD